MDEYPIVDLPGSQDWARARALGLKLDAAWPGQQGDDFAYAYAYHPHPEGLGSLVELVSLQEGDRDGPHFIWKCTFRVNYGTRRLRSFIVDGWCDYTGWDCQSGAQWMETT